MIRSFLRGLEDSNKPLLGPNYWILKKTGLILPENKFAKALTILIHEIVTFFVITQYMELYVIRSNLDLVLTNLKISMLSVVCIVKVNTFVFWQRKWKDIIQYVTESDIFERKNSDKDRTLILNENTAYCRRLTYFYWGLVFTTFLTTIFQPLMIYLSSATLRENYRNGTEPFLHIFSSWMPFDKNRSPGSYITIVWHTLLCAYGASIMGAYDSSICVIMVYFGGKIDLLKDRCKKMFLTKTGSPANTVQELHQIHVSLLKYLKSIMIIVCAGTFLVWEIRSDEGIFPLLISSSILLWYSRMFNSVLSPVMFFYMVMCSLMLCASAYQLTSATIAGQKLLLAEYLIFGIAQLFVFCWHSNDVLIRSQHLMLGPYDSEWWNATTHQRKDLLILSGQLRIQSIFTAGPFTSLTLPTFITILKGAYSYYTLLRK